ncbi:MAG: hypothetical protein AAF363_15775 [Bacteroidota bacterium]
MARTSLVLVFLWVMGCRTVVPVSTTSERTDSVIIREVAVPVKIESSEVVQSINYDSIKSLLKSIPHYKEKVIYLTDPNQQTKLTFFLDSLSGEVVAQCETLEREHLANVKQIERIYKERISKIEREKQTWFSSIQKSIGNLVMIICAGFILILLGQFLIKRFA